jgi:hypothetical protein
MQGTATTEATTSEQSSQACPSPTKKEGTIPSKRKRDGDNDNDVRIPLQFQKNFDYHCAGCFSDDCTGLDRERTPEP